MLERSNISPTPNFVDPTPTAKVQPFPNVSFYGAGYDVLFTDPVDYARPRLQEGGIRQSPVQLTLTQTASVGNQQFRFPGDASVTPSPGGTKNLTLKQVFRQSDYASALGATATIKAGLPGILAFSASASFKQSFTSSQGFTATSFYVTREVRLVEVELASGASMTVSPGFANVVGELSTSSADAGYQKLIDVFGTHYATAVLFGGQAFQLTTVFATTMASMIMQKIDVTAGASGAFAAFTASGMGSFDEENTRKYQQATSTSRHIENYSGGTDTNGFDTWAPTVIDSPVPIALALTAVPELMTAANFPSDRDIAKKRSLLEQAIAAYLEQGAAAGSQAPLESGKTRFALVDASGNFATHQDEEGPLMLTFEGSLGATFAYNNPASSPLRPNVAIAITDHGVSGHLGIDASGSFAMGQNNGVLATKLVSVFDDPNNPGTAISGLPSEVHIGDQVYVIAVDEPFAGFAMQTAQNLGGPLPAVAPTVGDPTIVWRIVPAPKS